MTESDSHQRHRLPYRLLKAAILFGALGLLVEGLFEVKLLIGPIFNPPSVPGQSKIIEHFMVQHITFPIIGLLLVFRPLRLRALFASRFASVGLSMLAILVTIPETIVSQTDLFRPYPFALHSSFLNEIQMMQLGELSLNLLQAQHLIFAHFILMGMIVIAAISGTAALLPMAGPRTGGIVWTRG